MSGQNSTFLIIDNYDSFTYNLVQYLGELGATVIVKRNDAISVAEIRKMNPVGIVISPGPKRPEDAGVCNEVIAELGQRIPILGVCLGHQCIGHVFGGEIVRAPRLMHGKTSLILHQGESVFAGLPSPFAATRYHSLIVRKETLPECLKITATADTPDQEIMGLMHKEWPIHGVQFHPESILTEHGKDLLKNFMKIASAT
ncbi:MAG: aminodeoxychorismate/anthranilate synthase component II [Methylacidiphilales bacterium]|nr:aminodeoxychorismate/anthranilate synthase component II [Candidatus Methylacidiphilales bacterium]MDW8349442.1 aminodeoxychorismate/anthranilate synthase component II [Verrucomicrobiae bacterium]